jgi:hypothetical protein
MPGYDTPEDGFLWKPVADSGGLVILLPSKYRNSSVKLIGPDGNVIEEGRSSGYANGNREHFRFGQNGGEYPNGTVVEVTTSDGNTMRYQIGNTSSRVEAGGVTSGGSSLAGASDYLTSPTNLNIQKPNVAKKFAQAMQQSQPTFKAPISTLETVRTMSNIVRGSAKSYKNIMKVAEAEEVTSGEESNDPYANIRGIGRIVGVSPAEKVGTISPRPESYFPNFKIEYKDDATEEQIAEFEKHLNPWHGPPYHTDKEEEEEEEKEEEG